VLQDKPAYARCTHSLGKPVAHTKMHGKFYILMRCCAFSLMYADVISRYLRLVLSTIHALHTKQQKHSI
jgi:hypothetical protein